MKLSVVIPAHNEEAYIAACLASLIKERGAYDVQIIVVNNASTDRTKEIALSFKDAGVTVVDENKKGLTHARQAGLEQSLGDLVAHVDADSIIPEGWIRTIMQTFTNDPLLVALSGPVIYYDMSLGANVLVRFYYYLAYLSYLISRFILRVSSLVQGSNVVIRRSALRAIGGYNIAFPFYGEDTEIARRLHAVGPVRFTLALPMYTSGRRLKSEGILTMAVKYPLNYIWAIVFHRPFHTAYTDVRSPTHETTAPFRTTVTELHETMVHGALVCTALVMIVIGSGVYVSDQLVKLAEPTVAEARQSDSFMVRKLGPSVIKFKTAMHNLRYDTDE